MTELALRASPSVSPPKIAARKTIPKKNSIRNTNRPTTVAITLLKNFIIVFFDLEKKHPDYSFIVPEFGAMCKYIAISKIV
ncbi:hypothetical protein GCM10008015_18490 [Flavobacterium palustre]|uniref:Uncharacterized protein n=1 Tax=Flavobacterium palustre TaxID=1476463 RepID=A0ABQ1HIV3_9FLAO|nr:hypothetical protein GCM10008015_18490 [Flavobacterium palustre]